MKKLKLSAIIYYERPDTKIYGSYDYVYLTNDNIKINNEYGFIRYLNYLFISSNMIKI